MAPAPGEAGARTATDAHRLVHQLRGKVEYLDHLVAGQSGTPCNAPALLPTRLLDALAQFDVGLQALVETAAAFTAPVIPVVRDAAVFPRRCRPDLAREFGPDPGDRLSGLGHAAAASVAVERVDGYAGTRLLRAQTLHILFLDLARDLAQRALRGGGTAAEQGAAEQDLNKSRHASKVIECPLSIKSSTRDDGSGND